MQKVANKFDELAFALKSKVLLEGSDNDFLEVEKLLKNIKSFYEEQKTSSCKNVPMCPRCLCAMVETKYNGYYESFCYWACRCDDKDFKVEDIFHGQFA